MGPRDMERESLHIWQNASFVQEREREREIQCFKSGLASVNRGGRIYSVGNESLEFESS